jgi:azurin
MIDRIFIPPTVHYTLGTAVLVASLLLAVVGVVVWWRAQHASRVYTGVNIVFQLLLMLQVLIGMKLLDQGLGVLQLYIHYLGGTAPLFFMVLLSWLPMGATARRSALRAATAVLSFAFVALTYFVGGDYARVQTLRAVPVATSPAPVAANAPTARPPVLLELSTAGDAMRFDKPSLEAPAGARITLRFHNAASPNGMLHNAVLVQPGTADAVGVDAIASNNPATWLKDNDARVIAATCIVRGGGVTEVTFDAPPPGTYTVVCTFPGHHTLMQIPFVVK